MFDYINIEKTGRELKDACIVTLNRNEFKATLDNTILDKLRIMSTNLTDSNRYNITIEDASILGF